MHFFVCGRIVFRWRTPYPGGMSTTLFGYTARKQAQSGLSVWLRLAGAATWFGLLLGCLIWWNGSIDPHESIKQGVFALTAILSIPLLVVGSLRDSFRRPFAWMTLFSVGLLLLSSLVSWGFAPDGWLAFFGTAGSISTSLGSMVVAGMFFLAMGMLASRGWKPKSGHVYAAMLAVLFLAVVQRVGWIDLSSGGIAARVFSPLGNQGALSWLVMCLTLFALAEEVLSEEAKADIETILRRVFFVASLAWLGSVDQTAIWILLLIGSSALFATVTFSQTIRIQQRSLAWIAVTAVVALAGLFVRLPSLGSAPTLVSLSGRESMRVVGLSWKQGDWLVGAGQGQWLSVFEKVRPAELNDGSLYAIRFDTGGAYFWTLLLQQGLLGGIAWGLVLLFAAIKTVSNVRARPDLLPLALAVWAGLGALFATQPHVWGVVLLFAGLGYLVSDAYEASTGTKTAFLVVLSGFGLALIATLPFIVGRGRADSYLRHAQSASQLDERRRLVHQAEAASPWSADAAFAGVQIDAAWISQRVQSGIADPVAFQSELAAAIERSKRTTSRWPNDPAMWLAQGALYLAISPVTQGADQFAMQAYSQGSAQAPQHPGFALGMAQIFLQRARSVESRAAGASAEQMESIARTRLEQLRLAAEWYERALQLKPDDLATQYAYAATLARSGNVKAALPLFRQLIEREPSRADLALEYAVLLSADSRLPEAIAIAEKISTKEASYLDSRRLLADWYEKAGRFPEAVAALRTFPLEEQKTAAFRQRLNTLQSKGTAPAR